MLCILQKNSQNSIFAQSEWILTLSYANNLWFNYSATTSFKVITRYRGILLRADSQHQHVPQSFHFLSRRRRSHAVLCTWFTCSSVITGRSAPPGYWPSRPGRRPGRLIQLGRPTATINRTPHAPSPPRRTPYPSSQPGPPTKSSPGDRFLSIRKSSTVTWPSITSIVFTRTVTNSFVVIGRPLVQCPVTGNTQQSVALLLTGNLSQLLTHSKQQLHS